MRALAGTETFDLTVEDEDGYAYTASLHGAFLAGDDMNGIGVYPGKDQA